MNQRCEIKNSIFLCMVALTMAAGCAAPAGMMPKEIEPSAVPRGLWDEYEVVVPNLELPTYESTRITNSGRPNDCPDTRIAPRKFPNVVCKETRVLDTERNCDMVFSTFGAGLCPSDQGDDYAQKMAQLEAIRLAGDAIRTAVQNSMMQKVVADSVRAQQAGADFLRRYKISEISGPAEKPDNGVMVTETVIPSVQSFNRGEVMAISRSGYYADCIKPLFNTAAVMEFNKTYIRILADELLCKTSGDSQNYRGTYLNSKMSNGQSWVLDLSLEDAGPTSSICVNDYYGNCRFKKENLLRGKDFELVRGFVQDVSLIERAAILSSVDESEVTIVLTGFNGEAVSETVVLTPQSPLGVSGGLRLRLNGIEEDRSVGISIEGEF